MMFTGTSQQQDTRFSDKEKKLLKQMRFGDRLNKRVDMSKVKLDVLRPWISKKITDILHIEEEDDVVVEFVYNQLEEEKYPCPKKMQINMAGFLNGKNARQFMDELWELLLSAQESESGIPAKFIEQKKEKMLKRVEEKKLHEAKEGFDKDTNKEIDLRLHRELSREFENCEKRTPSSEKGSSKIYLAEEMLEKSFLEIETDAFQNEIKSNRQNSVDRGRHRGREREKSRDHDHDRDKSKDLAKLRDKSRDRDRRRSRDWSRDRRSMDRIRDRSRDRSRDRRRSRSSRHRNTRLRRSRSRDNRRDRRTPSRSKSRRRERSASRSRNSYYRSNKDPCYSEALDKEKGGGNRQDYGRRNNYRRGGSGDRGRRDRRSVSKSRNNSRARNYRSRSRNRSPANRRDNWDNRYPRRRSPIRRDYREQRDARRILLCHF